MKASRELHRDLCADAGPNSPRSPRATAWETRREKYGPSGHAGYNLRRKARSPLETAALRLIIRLHEEEVLSEGQCCQALDIDRIEFREIMDSFEIGNTVAGRIYAARKAAGLTQDQVATHVGLARAQIANIEGGRSGVSVDQLMSFAEVLGISPEKLLPVAARATGPASPQGNSGRTK